MLITSWTVWRSTAAPGGGLLGLVDIAYMVSLPEPAAAREPAPKASSTQRRMNPTEIEFALRDLVSKSYDTETFPYDLIAILNASKVTVSRLKSGTTNKATQQGDVLWQKQFFFRPAQPGEDVGAVSDALMTDPLTAKHKPRFIMVTNGQQVHIRDLKLDETANVEFKRLDEQSYFLLPLAGYERRAIVEEHPADIKAAKMLKKLYDAILAANPTWNSGHHSHELNLLMTRLLFCFYAEDTKIFDTPQIFTNSVTQHTSEDGGDVAPLLDRLFRIMNIEASARPDNTVAVDTKFPYVNGSLFEDTVEIPQFSRTARRQLLECGALDWRTINPDIFGSMIQTIAHDSSRGDLGLHYTSVPNIMKVLQPLFLDSLDEAYEKAKHTTLKLQSLLDRIARIRIFDPACGSGNFLVIAYKELRNFEMRVLHRMGEIAPNKPLPLSSISLEHFFGIDIVDFACETAKLSLWIAEYQMNSAFKDLFGTARPVLPLGKISTIYCANATRLDWLIACPQNADNETFICGNPPYVGAKYQTTQQKSDVASIFSNLLRGDVKVDYISCWFVALVNYIADSPSSSGAFVSTNSICQGEHVPYIWPYIFSRGIVIQFAHTSFKWANSASNNAGVSCVIVGLNVATDRKKSLYTDNHRLTVPNINAYLVPSSSNVVVEKRSEALNGLPEPREGDRPGDRGNLTLSPAEKTSLIADTPEASRLIRRFYSSEDFLHNIERYVLWINDEDLPIALSIPAIVERIRKTGDARRNSGARDGERYAAIPHRFEYARHRDVEALVIPVVSTERRQYLQIGVLNPLDIASNQIYVIYSPPPFLMSILSSRLHRIWAQTVGGKLEDRLRYSKGLVYNTFPTPYLSDEQKRVLADHSKAILKARARHPGKAIAVLYNPETMPEDLLQAHRENDMYLEECVYGRRFADDTHRLEHLFDLYGRLTRLAGARRAPLFSRDVKQTNHA